MTQPPGGPYGGPGPYPQQPPYGQQPGGVRAAGVRAAGAVSPSPPPPPQKKNLLPWFIVGGAVLLSGLGILLVVLLRGDDSPDTEDVATNSTAPAPATSSSADASAGHADLPGGAQVAEEQTSADQSRYEGSADTALAWVQAMAEGEFQTAYDLSCADVQASAAAAARRRGPRVLARHVLLRADARRPGFSDGTFDSILYSEASDTDVASFTLQLDNGEEFLLLVYVQPDQKVCDFL